MPAHHDLLPILASMLFALAGCPSAPPGGGGGDDDDTADDDTGDDDTAPAGDLDVLLIVDSSNSMHADQQALAAALPAFLDPLDGAGVDYRIGVTTTQAMPCEFDPSAFAECEDAVGNTGRLRGLDNAGQDTSHPPTVVTPQSAHGLADLQALVQVGIDGATQELGLFNAAQAVCASLSLPAATDFAHWDETPWDCSGTNWDPAHPWYDLCRCLPPESVGYNTDAGGAPFLRDATPLLIVIVSDEGDFTPHLGTQAWPWSIAGCTIGEPWPPEIQGNCASNPEVICEDFCRLQLFLDFFGSLDRAVTFAVLGVGAELDEAGGNWVMHVDCNDQNSSVQMIGFYLWATYLTDGLYEPLDVRVDKVCTGADLGVAMGNLAQLALGR